MHCKFNSTADIGKNVKDKQTIGNVVGIIETHLTNSYTKEKALRSLFSYLFYELLVVMK